MVRFIFILLITLTTVAPVTVKVNCVCTVQHDQVYLYPPTHSHTSRQTTVFDSSLSISYSSQGRHWTHSLKVSGAYYWKGGGVALKE